MGLIKSEKVDNSDDESSSSDDEAAVKNKAAADNAVKKMEATQESESDSDADEGGKVVRVDGPSDSD